MKYISWPALKPEIEDADRFQRQIDAELQKKRPNWSFIRQWERDKAVSTGEIQEVEAVEGGKRVTVGEVWLTNEGWRHSECDLWQSFKTVNQAIAALGEALHERTTRPQPRHTARTTPHPQP